jgi:alpha-tubulin suppressor-like RCC1 family protein
VFIKQVSCGNHHSALLTIDGLIYTMGSNIHGTLGLENGQNINYAFRPSLVKEIRDVDQIFSGSYHVAALRQGTLYTWGKGIDGQLGHGNCKNLFTPTKVQTLGN